MPDICCKEKIENQLELLKACKERLGKARAPKTDSVGHPQTCDDPDVCLGIAHVSGKAPLSGQGVWQIHNVSAPFTPRNLRAKRADTLCIYQTLPDTGATPKHTSG